MNKGTYKGINLYHLFRFSPVAKEWQHYGKTDGYKKIEDCKEHMYDEENQKFKIMKLTDVCEVDVHVKE